MKPLLACQQHLYGEKPTVELWCYSCFPVVVWYTEYQDRFQLIMSVLTHWQAIIMVKFILI